MKVFELFFLFNDTFTTTLSIQNKICKKYVCGEEIIRFSDFYGTFLIFLIFQKLRHKEQWEFYSRVCFNKIFQISR